MPAKKSTRKVAKKAAKKTAKKTAKNVAKKVTKKAAKAATKKATRLRAVVPSYEQLEVAAFYIYLRRCEQGLPGTPEDDWAAAVAQFAA